MKCAECFNKPHINHTHFLQHAEIDEREINDLLHNEFIDKKFGEKLKLNLENKFYWKNIKITDIEFNLGAETKKRNQQIKIIKLFIINPCYAQQLNQLSSSKKKIGFVPNMSTLTNIQKMILDIQSYKKNDNKTLIFIDFKSVFNSIKRSLLYEMLNKQKILENEEIEFLKCLHSHIHYKSKDKIFYYMNGVPQGSMVSPALFNIYFEESLDEIKYKYKYTTIYAYADDVAFLLNDSDIPNFINTLQDVSSKYCLSINKSKNGIIYFYDKINIQNTSYQTDQSELLQNYPVIDEYSYLGIQINNCDKIMLHAANLIAQWNIFLITLNQLQMKPKKKTLLWKCYIFIHHTYYRSNYQNPKETIFKLWKHSFKKNIQYPKNYSRFLHIQTYGRSK